MYLVNILLSFFNTNHKTPKIKNIYINKTNMHLVAFYKYALQFYDRSTLLKLAFIRLNTFIVLHRRRNPFIFTIDYLRPHKYFIAKQWI